MFVNAPGTAVIEAGPKDGHGKCYICDTEVPIKKMREHVARHILAAQLSIREPGKHLITVSNHPSPLLHVCHLCIRVFTALAPPGWQQSMRLLRANRYMSNWTSETCEGIGTVVRLPVCDQIQPRARRDVHQERPKHKPANRMHNLPLRGSAS